MKKGFMWSVTDWEIKNIEEHFESIDRSIFYSIKEALEKNNVFESDEDAFEYCKNELRNEIALLPGHLFNKEILIYFKETNTLFGKIKIINEYKDDFDLETTIIPEFYT